MSVKGSASMGTKNSYSFACGTFITVTGKRATKTELSPFLYVNTPSRQLISLTGRGDHRHDRSLRADVKLKTDWTDPFSLQCESKTTESKVIDWSIDRWLDACIDGSVDEWIGPCIDWFLECRNKKIKQISRHVGRALSNSLMYYLLLFIIMRKRTSIWVIFLSNLEKQTPNEILQLAAPLPTPLLATSTGLQSQSLGVYTHA